MVNADISRAYEEYVAIFDRYYAEDVEVASDANPDPAIGKEKVLPVLFNFLVTTPILQAAFVSLSIYQRPDKATATSN